MNHKKTIFENLVKLRTFVKNIAFQTLHSYERLASLEI
jgi:hypothetical protein